MRSHSGLPAHMDSETRRKPGSTLLLVCCFLALPWLELIGTNAAEPVGPVVLDAPAAGPSPLSLLFFDDFNRPDTVEPGLGIPTLGPPWTMFGIGGLYGRYGCIRDHRFVTTAEGWAAVTYAGQHLPATPVAIEAGVIWNPGDGNGAEGCVTMACGPTNLPVWFSTVAHARFHRYLVAFDIFVNGSYFGDLGAAQFAPLPFGQTNVVRMSLSPESNSVTLYVNGVPMLTVTDPRIRAVSGPYAFWEHYYSDKDARSRTSITRVAAYANESPIQLSLSAPAYLDCGEVEIEGTTATPVGVIERVSWDWGDGTITEGQPPAWHRYVSPGEYQVKVTAFSTAKDSRNQSVPVQISSIDRSCENTLRVGPPEVLLRDGRTNLSLAIDIRDRAGHPVPHSPSDVTLWTDRPDLVHLQPDGTLSSAGLGRARVFVRVHGQARTAVVPVSAGRFELVPAIMLLHLYPGTNGAVEVVARNADGSPADLTGRQVVFRGGNSVARVDEKGAVTPLRVPTQPGDSPRIAATLDGVPSDNSCLVRVTEVRLRRTTMESFPGKDVALLIPTLNGTNSLASLFSRLEAGPVLDALSARLRRLTGTIPTGAGTQYVVLDPGSDVSGSEPCASAGNPIRLATGTEDLIPCTGGEDWIQWGLIGQRMACNFLHHAGLLDFLAGQPHASAYVEGLATALSVACFEELLSEPERYGLSPATVAAFHGTYLSLMPDSVRSAHYQMLRDYETNPVYGDRFTAEILDAQLTLLAEEYGNTFLIKLMSVFCPAQERFMGFASDAQHLTFWVAACSAAAGTDLRDRFIEKWGYTVDHSFYESILPQLRQRAERRNPVITRALLEGNQFSLGFSAIPETLYRVQTSQDLRGWGDLKTVVAGGWEATAADTISNQADVQYYRLLQLR